MPIGPDWEKANSLDRKNELLHIAMYLANGYACKLNTSHYKMLKF
jgi:hypothetical protein